MRKSVNLKRPTRIPDPKFNDTLASRFINNIMYDGKKSVSQEIFYNTIDVVAQRTREDGLAVWKKALSNVSPQVEVKSRRVGGANFQIPQEVRPERKIALGMKWMIMFARKRNEKSMHLKLASEIIAASKGEGAAFKKKEDVHKMAEANKAYSHFRF